MADAHAPGKLVVCGEYGVLHGAPAIAVAVDVRARAVVTAARGPGRLLIPDEGAWSFDWSADGALRWLELPPAGQRGVLEAVAAVLGARGVTVPQPLEISLDSSAFRRAHLDGSRDKLGLGSSAAVTVALVAALLASAGRDDHAERLAVSLHAHRRLQGGVGSGIDVAAAVHGGVVTLVNGSAWPSILPLAWPAGLHALAAWSGQAASTPELVARFDAFARADPVRFGRCIGELRRIAADALEAWQHADVRVVLRALSDYDDALRALDDGAHIGMHTPAHERLARAAQAAGAAYKISGAGGGDFGIAFAGSRGVIAALESQWTREGVVTLPIGAGIAGVTVG